MVNRMSSGGQVTLPRRVRDHLGLEPGEGVAFDVAESGVVTVRKAGTPRHRDSEDTIEAAVPVATLSLEEIQVLTGCK